MTAWAELSFPAFITDIQPAAEHLVNIANFECSMLEVRLCYLSSKKSDVVMIASRSAAQECGAVTAKRGTYIPGTKIACL